MRVKASVICGYHEGWTRSQHFRNVNVRVGCVYLGLVYLTVFCLSTSYVPWFRPYFQEYRLLLCLCYFVQGINLLAFDLILRMHHHQHSSYYYPRRRAHWISYIRPEPRSMNIKCIICGPGVIYRNGPRFGRWLQMLKRRFYSAWKF